MRYFLDFEFDARGPIIEPISLGIVREPLSDTQDTELYIEFDFDPVEVRKNTWVWQHVVPLLTTAPERRLSPDEASEQMVRFIGDDPEPEMWGYYAAYDYVIWCHRIFGGMAKLPSRYPQLWLDLQQMFMQMGSPRHLKPPQPKQQHNALADARWNREFHRGMTGQ